MSIVRTDIPLTSEGCDQMILALAEAYPFCRTEVIGTTAFQRPVRSLVIGSSPRKVIFSAAHHANEWLTGLILLKFAEELANAIQTGGTVAGVAAQPLVQTVTVHMVPMVDPDGVDLVTGAIGPDTYAYESARILAQNYPAIPFPSGWKANLEGVDLNLQYPAGWLQAREIKFSQGFTKPGPRDYVGRAPLNQPESRALADYTESVDPHMVLAFHSQGRVIYWQFRDYEVPEAEKFAGAFARVSGYALEDTPLESSFAGYKDWFIQKYRRPGYTIEVGQGENPLPLEQFPDIYRDNLGILLIAASGNPDFPIDNRENIL